ncbi:MAG: peptidoglycan editing factor PgeF [Ketobacteraceae bacterium]|nr:peptidoglycan editing factor PgeF [Ketobacteraceae bacterium]
MLILEKQTRWLTPDWPAPASVKALVTTRLGHLSKAPFDGFNTAAHVGDDPDSVALCRRFFLQQTEARQPAQWLEQVHGTDVVEARPGQAEVTADGCFTRQTDMICTLHTADCLPVFFCDGEGEQVALAHAGWRGLAEGILERTLETFACPPRNLICWLGPAISQRHFEVGPEVRRRFYESQPVPESAIIPSGRVSEQGEHYLADLYQLARARLLHAGVTRISGGDFCTFSDPRFFSYRRANPTGRLLSAIWIQSSC